MASLFMPPPSMPDITLPTPPPVPRLAPPPPPPPPPPPAPRAVDTQMAAQMQAFGRSQGLLAALFGYKNPSGGSSKGHTLTGQ